MDLSKYKIVEVHISTITHGDTILHLDGLIYTVGKNWIKKGFMGITLYGDSYNLGTILVKKIII